MKILIIAFVILSGIFTAQVSAQKYTINFTPANLIVNEDAGTIQITARLTSKPTRPVAVDVILDKANGDFSPKVITTIGFQPGDTVSSITLNILDNKHRPYKRIHRFTMDDWNHDFIKGHDSIFNLTIVDNDTALDAGISNYKEQPTITLYPNPCHGILNISTAPGLSGPLKIDAYDVAGKLLKTYNPGLMPSGSLTILLPENTKGMVFLRIKNENSVAYKRVLME